MKAGLYSSEAVSNTIGRSLRSLDNQTKPRAFAGQKVEVAGNLDKAKNAIHVTSIKAAS
jgi:hypothetical protein